MTGHAAEHERFMNRALELARAGEGLTRPNPPVGALCVRGGRVVGEGYHRRAGGAHAEIEALRAAGKRARGATLYVTLEPCSTTGRTPPCTEAILDAGIARIVVAARDPNPEHAGRGLRLLRRRGMPVLTGIGQAASEELLQPFRTWIQTGRPYFTLKLGITLDGRIADHAGQSKWITGPAARAEVQALRRKADAILVGRRTVAEDAPRLIPRPARGRKPYRVVVDTRGRLPATTSLFSDPYVGRTVLATTELCPAALRRRLQARGGTCIVLPQEGGRVSLPSLARALGRMGILHVLCEGGGELAEGLVRADLVDEYHLFVAPTLLGGSGLSALGGVGWPLPQRPRLTFTGVEQLGEDLHLTARPR